MPAWTDGAPFWGLFAFFFAVVLVRTQATYWLARLVAAWSADDRRRGPATRRPRWLLRAGGWLRRASEGTGLRAVERWGLLAVPASFLATGTKTAVNGAAGLLRMPFGRYTAAMLVGCALHAAIYATVGWAAWTAALSAATGSVWGAAALTGVALVVVVLVVRAVRRGRRGSGAR
ncbi:hypothetical protein FHN55_16360 [Streptomyces sp. NP160]|uniref:hypothetical protein n=1 Tax=Streptomyces sp. NP160 TaxID=2586637 RepID=UPI00111B32DC|nr:hypothetical protein [Streptomyces sp. NP160]TNM62475.1 hypothetical protein FHN55_16360 [Streptomyces sp. NP160]